ncbi:MAG: hypothetical protein KDA72_19250, partial [Planctomycetales bacterium]|nr:hypothetical protein [Planctomycetales bacterium]
MLVGSDLIRKAFLMKIADVDNSAGQLPTSISAHFAPGGELYALLQAAKVKADEWKGKINNELESLDFSGVDFMQAMSAIVMDAKLNGQDASQFERLETFDEVMDAIRTWAALRDTELRKKAKAQAGFRPKAPGREPTYTDAQLDEASELSKPENNLRRKDIA